MQVADWIPQLLGFGSLGAAVAIAAARHFAKSWLDNQFQKRLENLKHEQGKELEDLKFRISKMLDRSVKLHQREFEVTPEVWDKIFEAFSEVATLTSRLRFEPDLSRLSNNSLNEFLENKPYAEFQKDNIRNSNDRNKAYRDIKYLYDKNRVEIVIQEARFLLIKKGIFIESKIYKELDGAMDMLRPAVIEWDFVIQGHATNMETPKLDSFTRDGQNRLMDVRRLIYERLWSSGEVAQTV